mgnify:CR=1 FL=1
MLNTKNLKKIKGVLFLQDFFDAPAAWGQNVFDDYYLWTLYSLMIIKKYKFNNTYTVIFHIDSRAYPAIPIFAYSYNVRQNNLLNNIRNS